MKQHATTARQSQVYREKVNTLPTMHARTVRPEQVSVVTSSFGGKLVPIKMIPLLREDGCSGRVQINVQMAETSEMLLNPVRCSYMAYFVPKLALQRFPDMGTIDRSYNKEQEIDGSVVPWFQPRPIIGTPEFYQTLGLHHDNGNTTYNDDYLEAYNCIWNYIATQRSPELQLRDLYDTTLAPAFWEHTQMKHVKPKFDQALIDGQVPLNVVSTDIAIKGIGVTGGFAPANDLTLRETGGSTRTVRGWPDKGDFIIEEDGDNAGYPKVLAQLQQDGITVSLANIDMARETAEWARMRNTYQGLDEEWMMDQLLAGIRIPDQSLKYPILLDHKTSLVGMTQRYATDSANLDQSMTDGRTGATLNIRVPQTTCGGIVVILAQALPEQIYERQRDHYFACSDQDDLPNRTSDELDPQPVEMVKNVHVDEAHSAPNDLFGYEPLNAKWRRTAPNVGGKYYEADPNAPWREDRNRIWDANVVDPQLGPDFYLATTLKHEVFADSNTDPFEWWAVGDIRIDGLTYFGPGLMEGQDDYDKVLEQVDQTRLEGDGTDTPT